MTNQIESPDGRPRKDDRPSPDTRGVADGGRGATVASQSQIQGVQGFEEAPGGKRTDRATSNLEQNRAVGQSPAREGSRQGKDAV